MPRYDFECAHGHRFERDCSIAERNLPVPCQGTVNQLLSDEDMAKFAEEVERAKENPVVIHGAGTISWVPIGDDSEETRVVVQGVPCMLKAKMVMSHSNPHAMVDHNMAANRDAAREGRYDPLNPSRRGLAKGRNWRK